MESPLFRVPSEEKRLALARLIARGTLARRKEEASDEAMHREVLAWLPFICVVPPGERRVDPRPRESPDPERSQQTSAA